MKQFDLNAIGLTITFIDSIKGEEISLDIDKIPAPNYEAESIRDSENYNEEEFEPLEGGDVFLVSLYVNTAEANVKLLNASKNIEISEFKITEHYPND